MVDTLGRWKNGLTRTSQAAFGRLAGLVGATELDSDLWETLEANLIKADLGVTVVTDVLGSLRQQAGAEGFTRVTQLREALRVKLRALLVPPPQLEWTDRPAVVLLVGVNGSGKTTTLAKLAHRFMVQGERVLIGAADTYRAAAVEQLQAWGGRLGAEVIVGAPDSDPGAVAYNAIRAGLARAIDRVLIDTAGRLHTRYNLMEELKKIQRVAGKAMPGAPHAVWLVLDATLGQNSLVQARSFKEAVGVSGVILAKLDSSAKGGMAFAVQHELGLPILFAGLGEGLKDLEVFDPEVFVEAILPF